jgi:hypothetical protein
MKAKHFRKYIIRAILQEYDCWSERAEELLLFTAVVESALKYVVQAKTGPARGYFQMEPWVCDDLIDARLLNNEDRRNTLITLWDGSVKEALKDDIVFMVLTCRYFYMEVPEALPDHNDRQAIYQYYKKHWNTEAGKATEAHCEEMWSAYGD